MIGLSKWARLTGHRQPSLSADESAPPEQLVIGSEISHLYPPVQNAQGFANTACHVDGIVDAPAGGFNPGDLLLTLPAVFGDAGTIGAVAAQDLTKAFYPGVYHCRFRIQPTVAVSNGKGLALQFLSHNNAPFPWGAASGTPNITLRAVNSIATYIDAVARFYFPVPFRVELRAAGAAWVDADIVGFHVDLDNEFLLDEMGVTEAFGRPAGT